MDKTLSSSINFAYSAPAMTCPGCQAQTPLTWERYFSSPLGHTCPKCEKHFKFPLTARHFSVLALAGLAAGALPTILVDLATQSLGIGLIAGWFVALLVILPLDRWMDDHYSEGKLLD